ncbi:response regulator [Candidatus Sumerlaeota bacterium]|nr:response regulator [Candidatus Sumerlaeota bacterium]
MPFTTRYRSCAETSPRSRILLSVLVFLAAMPFTHGQGPGDETILILNSYHRGKTFQDNIMNGIEATLLEARPEVRLCFEYMDTNVHKPETMFPDLERLYALKYGNTRIDLIIASDNSALDFLLAHRDELFQAVPIVFCGINGFKDSMIAGQKGITGVVELLDQKSMIELGLRLHPDTRNIVTLSDRTKTATLMREGLHQDFRDLGVDKKIQIVDIVSENIDEIKRRLREFSKDDTILIHASFTRGENGRPLSVETRWGLNRESGIPCYSPYSYSIGFGPVGGHVMDGFLHGETAARMGLQILDGASPESIPIVRVTPTLPKFDHEAMAAAGIRKRDLPPDSVVVNRPRSFYARHKAFVWSVGAGNVLLVLVLSVLTVNILRRRRAERLMAKGKEEWERTFDSVPDLIAILDPDRRILRANRAMANRMKQSPSQCLGGICCQAFHSGLIDPEICPHRQVMADGREHGAEIHDDETGAYFLVTASPLHDAEGRLIGSVHVGRDITERRNLEEQLRQAHKMEAIGQLAGGVAHDFNNLLQVIQGYGELALEESPEDTPVREELEEVMKATRRATSLVRQLLAFSRRQVLELNILDLSEIVGTLTAMIHRIIGEHITLRVRSGLRTAVVQADRGQMEQVLINLCVNARDAMPDGGEIVISTDTVELGGEFCRDHPGIEPGRYAVLSVADTGCGIDPTIRNRIFEPFFTTKSTGRGTGLGLSTVYGIVRQHEGTMDVHSVVGAGTEFRVYFPAAEGRAKPHEPGTDSRPVGGTETILVAEDDETVRGLVERILTQAGYKVLCAGDGEEALRMFDTSGEEIDLALLDIVMPNLSGKAVLDHIRNVRPETRILFASGYSTDTVHTDFLLNEGMRLVQKPYQRDTLLKRIRETLDASVETRMKEDKDEGGRMKAEG